MTVTLNVHGRGSLVLLPTGGLSGALWFLVICFASCFFVGTRLRFKIWRGIIFWTHLNNLVNLIGQ